jgi:hypothetical protein
MKLISVFEQETSVHVNLNSSGAADLEFFFNLTLKNKFKNGFPNVALTALPLFPLKQA